MSTERAEPAGGLNTGDTGAARVFGRNISLTAQSKKRGIQYPLQRNRRETAKFCAAASAGVARLMPNPAPLAGGISGCTGRSPIRRGISQATSCRRRFAPKRSAHLPLIQVIATPDFLYHIYLGRIKNTPPEEHCEARRQAGCRWQLHSRSHGPTMLPETWAAQTH